MFGIEGLIIGCCFGVDHCSESKYWNRCQKWLTQSSKVSDIYRQIASHFFVVQLNDNFMSKVLKFLKTKDKYIKHLVNYITVLCQTKRIDFRVKQNQFFLILFALNSLSIRFQISISVNK